MTAKRRRAVVIGGVRTPFVKAFGEFMLLDTIALGTAAVRGLLERYPIPRREIGALIWGGVILPAHAPNVGREIVLDLSREGRLDPEIEALTVTRACSSGLQAVTLAAGAIERGDADLIIAGGSDSTSNAEVKLPQKLVHAAVPFVFGKPTASDVLGALGQLWPPGDLLPRAPRIAERTTGQVMGEAAEDMARRNEISRAAQDDFAVRSHHRAAAAIAADRFAHEVVPVAVPPREGHGGNGSVAGESVVHADTLVRATTSVEKLARLSPAFAKDGSVTAGSSSPLTDGAAAVLLASEERAAALGLTPLARVTHWSYVGVDPGDQLLIGPALAMPRRHARSVRGAGAERAQDAGQRRLRARAPRPRQRGRGRRSGAPERARRVAGARTPVRGHRRAHGDDDGQRAARNREAHRAPRPVRRGRPRRRGIAGKPGELRPPKCTRAAIDLSSIAR
jgi:acetyl-CoA acyltransferase